MKINQLGTLAIIGVVVSFTVACNGSPTKPTAFNPPLGDGASVPSVNLSNVIPVGATDQVCTSLPQAYDEYGYQTGDIWPMTCEPAATEAAQEEVVVSDESSTDSAVFARRLHR